MTRQLVMLWEDVSTEQRPDESYFRELLCVDDPSLKDEVRAGREAIVQEFLARAQLREGQCHAALRNAPGGRYIQPCSRNAVDGEILCLSHARQAHEVGLAGRA